MLSEKKRQHLFFIEIPENNAKNSARQNVNYCVTNFLYTAARNQKSDVADEEQYQPDRSRQECQMAGGALPLGGKFRGEKSSRRRSRSSEGRAPASGSGPETGNR